MRIEPQVSRPELSILSSTVFRDCLDFAFAVRKRVVELSGYEEASLVLDKGRRVWLGGCAAKFQVVEEEHTFLWMGPEWEAGDKNEGPACAFKPLQAVTVSASLNGRSGDYQVYCHLNKQ